jgi:hypothetical protein
LLPRVDFKIENNNNNSKIKKKTKFPLLQSSGKNGREKNDFKLIIKLIQ